MDRRNDNHLSPIPSHLADAYRPLPAEADPRRADRERARERAAAQTAQVDDLRAAVAADRAAVAAAYRRLRASICDRHALSAAKVDLLCRAMGAEPGDGDAFVDAAERILSALDQGEK